MLCGDSCHLRDIQLFGLVDLALVMDSNSSHSTGSAPPTNMEEIAQRVQMLPEKTLNAIAKGPLVKLTLNCTDAE
jgi:hypothetical protein